MRKIIRTRQFDRDAKLAKRRGKDLGKLWIIVDMLCSEQPLPTRCRPHKLSGNLGVYWECHIEPDWLLIYELDDDELLLFRTGTHADLF